MVIRAYLFGASIHRLLQNQQVSGFDVSRLKRTHILDFGVTIKVALEILVDRDVLTAAILSR